MTRWAVITGAAGGIGQSLLPLFSRSGFRVIATDVVSPPVGLACEHYIHADMDRIVWDEKYATIIFDHIYSFIGSEGLDVLINNAAIQKLGGVESLNREDWRLTLNVNLVAPFLWAQAFLPQLEQKRGCIINISSIHANLTKKGFVAYATSKAALSGMTRAMAVDVEDRVRVNAIEPAAIYTEMLTDGLSDESSIIQRLAECHPQKRFGTSNEVANLALMLTRSELQFLHGECISLSGGIASRLHDPMPVSDTKSTDDF